MIRCAHCKERHVAVEEVRACSQGRLLYGHVFASVEEVNEFLAREHAAEVWAEEAMVRFYESYEYVCYCGAGQPGVCC